MIAQSARRHMPPADRLRVAVVITSKIWGGSEAQGVLLGQSLRALGHDCRFFVRRGGPVAQVVGDAGFRVHRFVGTGRDPWSIWRMRRHLRHWRPDVMHLNDTHAIACGGLAAWNLPIPARVALRRSIHPLRHAGRYLRFADRVICVARAVAQQCRRAGIDADRLRVVHDGVAPHAYRAVDGGTRSTVRRALGIDEAQPLLLTAAQLQPNKGHRYLIEAMGTLTARGAKPVVLLAGSGPGRRELETQVRRAGLARHVRFLGFRQDVARLLHAADLFVMPSLSEGLCTALIEAMVAGCPVVTTRVGGIAELIPAAADRRPIAWTVPPRDSAALARAIDAALASPHERALRAARARARAEAHFSAEQMVRETLAVYQELLSPGPPPVGQAPHAVPRSERPAPAALLQTP